MPCHSHHCRPTNTALALRHLPGLCAGQVRARLLKVYRPSPRAQYADAVLAVKWRQGEALRLFKELTHQIFGTLLDSVDDIAKEKAAAAEAVAAVAVRVGVNAMPADNARVALKSSHGKWFSSSEQMGAEWNSDEVGG